MADTRPPPKDLSHHLSRTANAHEESAIKSFYKYFQIPGIGQLAGGLPNNYYFPFDTLEAKVARPDRWQPTPNHPVDPPDTAEALASLSISDANNKARMSILDKKAKTRKSPLNQPQDAILVPHTSKQDNPTKKIDLASALQYGTAQGYPPLYYFVRELARNHLHVNCPYKDGPEVILSTGNSDGIAKVLRLLTNPWSAEKDWIREKEGVLVEEFAYMGAIQAMTPRGLNIVPVKIDREGILAEGPGGLRDVLERWDHRKGKRPHLIYTVTMGQNPTSGVLSLARRREIYALACQYDIIILEDDPYWFLQYPSATNPTTEASSSSSHPTTTHPNVKKFFNAEPHPPNWKPSPHPFIDSLVPSSLSIDTQGRVIRLDTFSKTVAPGCRLGWITAQPRFIERLLRLTETSTQQPSGFVQSMIAQLVLGADHDGIDADSDKSPGSDSGWKADGWIRWVEGLRGNYERRMNLMSRILAEGRYLITTSSSSSSSSSPTTTSTTGEEEEEQEDPSWTLLHPSPTPIYTFYPPSGGMFLWLRINFPTHPLWKTYSTRPHRLSKALWIFWTTKPYRVLVGTGTMFSPTEEIARRDGWRYFRLCFAAIDEELLGGVTERLVEGTRDFWGIEDEDVIEGLLEDDEKGVDVVADEEEGSSMRRRRRERDMADLVHLGGPC